MSFGSNLSHGSPPNYVNPKDQQVPTVASSFGGSQATSSLNGSSWADTVRGSGTQPSILFRSSEESETERAMKKDLESSREKVAKLKRRLAIIESIQAQEQTNLEDKYQVANERKVIDKQVKQQVSQFSVFSQQMITMFAQMMMSHQQESITTKRLANYMQGELNNDTHKVNLRKDSIKRRDNKTTPVKAIRKNEVDNNREK
jgi:hypothetical protein